MDERPIPVAWFYIWIGIGIIYGVYVIVFIYELFCECKKCWTRNRDYLNQLKNDYASIFKEPPTSSIGYC